MCNLLTLSFDIYIKWKLVYSFFPYAYLMFSKKLIISSKSGKHLPDFNHIEGCLSLESKRNNTGSKWTYFTPNLSLLIYVNASSLRHLINHTYRYLVSRFYFLINLISNDLAQRNSFLFIFNFINLFCLVWILINLNDNFTLLVYKHFFLAPIKSFNSFIQ